MSTPRVSMTKQLRRLRRDRIRREIARMTLQQQWDFACDLWRAEQILKRKGRIDRFDGSNRSSVTVDMIGVKSAVVNWDAMGVCLWRPERGEYRQ